MEVKEDTALRLTKPKIGRCIDIKKIGVVEEVEGGVSLGFIVPFGQGEVDDKFVVNVFGIQYFYVFTDHPVCLSSEGPRAR